MNKFEEDQKVLVSIRKGNELILEELYKKYRSPFIRWSFSQYTQDEELASEVYQRAFTTFYLNAKSGKLETLTSQIQTYIFGVGRRMYLEVYKTEAKRPDSLDDIPNVEANFLDLGFEDTENETHLKQVLGQLLAQIDDTCMEVLLLYYYESYTMESIAERLEYKNASVAKKKKYSCLQKLKRIVEEKEISI